MTTIKSYTDIEQSNKLAKILPLESADMFYNEDPYEDYLKDIVDIEYPMILRDGQKHFLEEYGIPCWSFAALLSIASIYCNRLEITLRTNKKYNVFAVKGDFVFRSFDEFPDGIDSLIDCCYELILKLKELNLL